MGRKYAAGFPQAKGVKSLFSNIIFFCFNSNILYTPLSHHKLWNVGIETLEKHTILEKPPRQAPLQVGGETGVTSREHTEAKHWTSASNNQGTTWKEGRRGKELEGSHTSHDVVGQVRYKPVGSKSSDNCSWWLTRYDPEAFLPPLCNMVNKQTGSLPAGYTGWIGRF